jgi:hypothetical protein
VVLGGDPAGGIPLPVPRTDPLVISVSWGTGRPAGQVDVRLHGGEEKLVPVDGGRVELDTITGRRLVLRRAMIGRIFANGNDRGAGFAVTGQAVLTAAHNLPDNVAMQAAWSADRAITYVTEAGESFPAEISAADAELDAVLLRPVQPVPDVLPIGDYAPGVGCRLQAQGPAGRQALRGTVLGITRSVGGEARLLIRGDFGDLRGQSGTPVTLETPGEQSSACWWRSGPQIRKPARVRLKCWNLRRSRT